MHVRTLQMKYDIFHPKLQILHLHNASSITFDDIMYNNSDDIGEYNIEILHLSHFVTKHEVSSMLKHNILNSMKHLIVDLNVAFKRAIDHNSPIRRKGSVYGWLYDLLDPMNDEFTCSNVFDVQINAQVGKSRELQHCLANVTKITIQVDFVEYKPFGRKQFFQKCKHEQMDVSNFSFTQQFKPQPSEFDLKRATWKVCQWLINCHNDISETMYIKENSTRNIVLINSL